MTTISSEMLAYGVRDLQALLPISRTKIYQAIKRGDLRARKYGRSTIFLASDVAAFLANLPDFKAGGRS